MQSSLLHNEYNVKFWWNFCCESKDTKKQQNVTRTAICTMDNTSDLCFQVMLLLNKLQMNDINYNLWNMMTWINFTIVFSNVTINLSVDFKTNVMFLCQDKLYMLDAALSYRPFNSTETALLKVHAWPQRSIRHNWPQYLIGNLRIRFWCWWNSFEMVHVISFSKNSASTN